MAPKKTKASKMSLNEFLGDSTLGSWADEMDSLPTAPSIKSDEDRLPRSGDRFSRRDDFASSRPDRPFSVREEVPLPSHPPFTAFIGNLAFDITENELASFFSPHQAKSIKIIKDREDKPKGFGYVEFAELDALKDALSRSGTVSGRVIRVSVAEPPKEKSGFGGAIPEDDSKFSGNWRREGPLPSLGDSRDSSRRRFEGQPGERQPPPSSVSDEASDWRSSRPLSRVAEPEPSTRRRGSGFSITESQIGAADREEHWTMGSKFKPSAPEESTHGKFGSIRKHEAVHTRDAPDEGDWRAKRAPSGTSPSNSTPPTPQISRKKLELLPRSSTGSTGSTSPSPLSSPKLASNAPRPSPFGAAKPVDISSKEREITTRLELAKDRVSQPSMSRTNSRQATERGSNPPKGSLTPPSIATATGPSITLASSTVRPAFSFASAAGAKTAASGRADDQTVAEDDMTSATDNVTNQVLERSD